MFIALAIKRPFSVWSRLLLGVLITAIPFLNFMTAGYALRVAQTARTGLSLLPGWHTPMRLWVDGLKALITVVLYQLPVAVVIWLTVIADFSGALLNAAVLLTGFVTLIILYLLPAALVLQALEGWRAAFRLAEVVAFAWNQMYAKVWLVAIVYGAIVGLIGSILALGLALLPLLPTVIIALSVFITQVVAMSLFGQLYKNY